jgi:hypothetical protein
MSLQLRMASRRAELCSSSVDSELGSRSRDFSKRARPEKEGLTKSAIGEPSEIEAKVMHLPAVGRPPCSCAADRQPLLHRCRTRVACRLPTREELGIRSAVVRESDFWRVRSVQQILVLLFLTRNSLPVDIREVDVSGCGRKMKKIRHQRFSLLTSQPNP